MGKPFALEEISARVARPAVAGSIEHARMARTLGVLFWSGATLALCGVLLLNLPEGANVPASLAVVAAGYCGGGVLIAGGDRIPPAAIQAFLVLGTACVTLGIHFSGDAATNNQFFYVWVGLYSGLFLSRRATVAQLAFVGAAYAAELALTQPGNEAVVHWLIAMGALGVVASIAAGFAERTGKEAVRGAPDALPSRALPGRALGGREVVRGRVRRALHRDQGSAPGGPAVALVSIDSFDLVRQSLTPDQCDRMLALLAGRLRAALGPHDTVAASGAGTFAAMLDDEDGAQRATQLAERVSERLRAPFLVDGRAISLGVSVDLPFDGAKAGGAARDDGAMARAARELELRLDLGAAIENDQFELHYQPKVSLTSGRVLGIEALVRWRHPRRGLIAPDEFIPTAEETGAIVPLGRIVLRRACMQARAWQTRFAGDPPLRVFVNLSARQLADETLVGDVSDALARSRLEPGSLALELTEGAVAKDIEQAAATLARLKDLGVALALDDFGVGHSSLGMLRRLPVDALKIDRSFVARMLDGPEDAAIVSAVGSLASALGLELVAEGVESDDQIAPLRELGCDLAQGFYFAHPLPAAEAADAIAARRRPRPA